MTNTTDSSQLGFGHAPEAEEKFHSALNAMVSPKVLELGTLRWEADRPTHHKAWAPHASLYVMSDVAEGTDVDLVSDAHTLSKATKEKFDAVIAISVWEHLCRPWVAAEEVAKVLAPGGWAFICTHQTFPLHGYPHDYFRFSAEALSLLFEDAGLVTVGAGYQYPCSIVPPQEVLRWNPSAPTFLNVVWTGYKPE